MLAAALREADEVIPFYCLEARFFTSLTIGHSKTGAFRKRFLWESLTDLDRQLQEKSSALWVSRGNAAESIYTIHKRFPLDAVYFSREATPEELEVEVAVEKLGIPTRSFWQSTLYHMEGLPFPINNLPWVFTEFRKKAEKQAVVGTEAATPGKIVSPEREESFYLPTWSELGWEEPGQDARAVYPFEGGEAAAWKRLQQYFWQNDSLKTYKETRNGLLGADYSSKLSPWLALGCISPVSVYWEVKEYERQRVTNSSTYWLLFELLWRDFFRFTAIKEGKSFFRIDRGALPEPGEKFEHWRLGETGQPFVDANMKELLHTGYMSNRGRQNVASYLVHDLKQHWYLGAQWFESQLIDYDVCSNYGNWTYVAGIGHDPRKNRYFNVEKQAAQYDPEGKYQKYWNEEE